MSTIKPSVWTHRRYCSTFDLNAEQYGEILVAQAVAGTKRGDAQPCFDVSTTLELLTASLIGVGVSSALITPSMLDVEADGDVRIEVKSKLRFAESGEASVIHCADTKLSGLKRGTGAKETTFPAMTHLVAVFVEPGTFEIANAWLLSRSAVARLRTKGKAPHLPVRAVREAADRTGIIDIARLLQRVADAPFPR